MFTGLVEEIGTITDIIEGTDTRLSSGMSSGDNANLQDIDSNRKVYRRFRISCNKIRKDMRKGDSISVNGVCQTVVRQSRRLSQCLLRKPAWFEIESLHMTLEKTAFSALVLGDKVNLERALSMNAHLGGHMVYGHVQFTAVVGDIVSDEANTYLHITLTDEQMRFVVDEGSVCIDGVSLTIARVDVANNRIMINIIGHTLENTCIQYYKKDRVVNIEFDMMYSYVQTVIEKYFKEKIR